MTQMKSAKKKPLAEQLLLLDKISRAISEADEIEPLLGKSLSCLMDNAVASAGAAYLMQNGAWQLRVSAGFSCDEISEISQLGARMNHCLNRLSESKDCVFLKPGKRHPRYCPGFPKDRRGNHWWIGVAVKSHGGPIGVLSLIGRRNEGPTPVTLEVLPILTGFIGAALEKAMLYEEALRKNRALKLYNEIARIISSSTDMGLVPNKCLMLLIKYLRIKGGVVFLRDERRGRLKMIAHQRTPRQMLQVIKEVRYFPYKASPLLTGRTAVIVDFTSTYPFLKKLASSYKFEVFISIPLRSKNKIVGLIDLAGLHKVNLGEIDVQLLDAIGNQLGIALDNAQTLSLVTGAEEKYRSIYESSSDILFTTNRTGTITSANPSFQETMGLREKELIGRKLSSFAARGYGKLVRDILRQSLTKRISSARELLLTARKGNRVISLRLGPSRNSAGEVVGVQGEGHDITNRHESETQYRLVFENSPVGIFQFDQNGVINACNASLSKILGTNMKGLIGFNLLASLANKKMLDAVRQALAGRLGHFEGNYVSITGGKAVTVKVDVAPVMIEKGRYLGGIGIMEDITERQRAEDALFETHQKYKKTVSSISDYLWSASIQNGKWKQEFITPVAKKITGYSLSDFLADPMLLLRMVHPDDKAIVMEKFKAMMKGSAVVYEHRITRKNGGLRWIRDSAMPTVDSSGAVVRVDGIVSDITERKQAEIDAEELRERLLQSEKLAFLGTMAAGVAHEINNPLSVITGMLQELVSKTQPDDRMYMKYLRLRKVADRIGRIVDGLLHFSHQNSVHFVPTDLHLVIDESLSMVREKNAFENIELVKKYADDIPKINVERDQISQVIINLVTNALDAMPDGGRLTISTGYKREKKTISISISDTGVGIGPEAKRKLFTPFYTTKEVGQGTGLGLAISYGIIQSHQGTLEVESELNKGSTFTINLPRGIHSAQKDGMLSFAGGRP